MRSCNCRSNSYSSQSCNSNCNMNIQNNGCNYQNQNMNNNNSNIYSDTCNRTSPFPINYMYGHAYTPNQIMNQTFTPEVGLQNGTIFPELVSPYCPGQSMDFINFLRTNDGMGGMQYE